MAGPLPSVPAMVVARSCEMVPMTSPVLAIFCERLQARQHDVHVGARQRELRRAEAVERMAEGIHAIAVDVGDRAGRAELEVAAHQRDADRIARAQPRRRGTAGRRGCLRRRRPSIGRKP